MQRRIKEVVLPRPRTRKRWLRLAALIALCSASIVLAGQVPHLEEEERRIAGELRCVVCQNLSIADSPSEMAQQMRAIIREQLEKGKTPAEIRAYFVSKYGEWVLLSPPAEGFSLLVWLLPFAALGGGIFAVAFFVRRWVGGKKSLADPESGADRVEQLRQEISPERADIDDGAFRRALAAERTRLRSELKELEFDRQAGRLSAEDYEHLRQDLLLQARAVEEEIGAFAPEGAGSSEASSLETGPELSKTSKPSSKREGIRSWQLASGGLFLLVLGITVGVLLSKSVRPRLSEQDTITGDFLTGTTQRDLSALLAKGRSAFERQEWGAAIQAFKEVLAIDENQPEANSYMGLILAQAGHVDGAIMAFDRVLAADANFPTALWGKGMLLYQVKKDYAQARALLQRLVALMPSGEERDTVQKILVEVNTLAGDEKDSSGDSRVRAGKTTIRGTVSLAPTVNAAEVDSAVLFIIARPADSAGPPLAVKKIERPIFPVPYVLGPEDSMIPGRTLAGKVFVSARLDRDGNALTQAPRDGFGQYNNNPVEVGAEGVDITIERPAAP